MQQPGTRDGRAARLDLRRATSLEAVADAAEACGLAALLDGPVGLFVESIPWDDHPAAPVLHQLVDQGWAQSLRDVFTAPDFVRRWRRRARTAGTAWLIETSRAFFLDELAVSSDMAGGGGEDRLHPESDGTVVEQWAHRRHVSDLLGLPVSLFLSRVSGPAHHHLSRFPVEANVLDLFIAPTAGPGVTAGKWPPVPFSLKLAVSDWLEQEAADVASVVSVPRMGSEPTRELPDAVRRWVEVLEAARTRLMAVTAPRQPLAPDAESWAGALGGVDSDCLRLALPPGSLPCHPGRPPAVTLRLDSDMPDQTARCDCGLDVSTSRYTLWAIDSVLHAINAGNQVLIDGLDARLGAPRWARELALFADAVGGGRQGAPSDALPGWRVRIDAPGAWTVEAVWARAYRRKPGVRIWPGRTEVTDPTDAAVFDPLRLLGGNRTVDAAVQRAITLRALEALVGHPSVFLASDTEPGVRAVAVQSVDVGLWLGPADGDRSLRLSVALDGRPWPEERVRREVLGAWAGDRAAWLDGGLRVARISESARRLMLLVVDRGPQYPLDALGTLIDRLPAFEEALPVHIDPSLIGPAVTPRPVLRLELDWRTPASGGEALFLRLRVCPLPGARPRRPGLGPARALGQRDGSPVHCFRDRSMERAGAEALLGDFGIAVPTGGDARWEFTLSAPEPAFAMVAAIDGYVAADMPMEVVWRGNRPSVRAADQPQALSMEVRPAGRRGWFRLDGALDLDAAEIALAELLDQARRGRRFVRLGPGQWAQLSEALHARLAELASVCRGPAGDELPGFSGGAVDALQEVGVRLDADTRWTMLRERVHAALHTSVKPPENLHCVLRPYQQQGFEWLVRLTAWGAGGILADDMGLGKTIQALALLAHRATLGPALVVAPSSLVFNWRDEARRFTPFLEVRSYRGAGRDRRLEGLAPGVVVLSTYDIVARDARLLAGVSWATLVLDEAQAIKNPDTQRAKAVFSLPAEARIALSGTPIENRLEELWSLLEAVCPGLLGPRAAFREDFVMPIEGDGDDERQSALARIIQPFVLRRLKSEVASELPAREMVVRRIPARTEHAGHYARERQRAVAETRQLLASEADGAQMKVLAWITRLRMLACHPALVDPGWPHGSAKLDFALEQIRTLVQTRHAVLVFSQFTRHLDLVQQALDASSVSWVRIDGRTSPSRREAAVREFQAGEVSVFLLSLKAGGVGLNLTAADHVLLLDPWWNPAAEDQAADRAHRIGQQRPVTIMRLVTAGTLEDDILALQADKRALIAATLAGTGTAGRLDGLALAALIQGSDALRADLEAEIPFGHGTAITQSEAGT